MVSPVQGLMLSFPQSFSGNPGKEHGSPIKAFGDDSFISGGHKARPLQFHY